MSVDAADDQPQRFVTIGLEEAAALLRVSRDFLMRQARAGKVPGYRPGRQWVFLPHEIEAYLRASARAPAVNIKSLRRAMAPNSGGSDLVRELQAKLRKVRS